MDTRKNIRTQIYFDAAEIDGVRAFLGFVYGQKTYLHPKSHWKVFNFAEKVKVKRYPREFSRYIILRYCFKHILERNILVL
jgi:hypothetical protein